MQNLCKVGQRGRRPIKKGDGRRKCRHEQFLVWPAFERTSKPVARSHYHPSILAPLPLPPLSSFAHSNMYPSTHAAALATLPHSPVRGRPPCPRPIRAGNIIMAISVMQQPTPPARSSFFLLQGMTRRVILSTSRRQGLRALIAICRSC